MKVNNKKAEADRRFWSNLYIFLVALSILPICLMAKADLADASSDASEISSNVAPNLLKNEISTADKTETASISDYFEQETVTYSAPVAQVANNSSSTSNNVSIANYLYPNQIAIGGNIIPIFYSSNTAIDAGYQVGLWGTHFLYGHNYGSIFGVLAGLPDGTRFSVTLDGNTRNYQIVGRVVLDYTDPSRDDYAQKHMYSLAVLGAYQGVSYDYVMMTCAGQSLGGGNATHRLVVFANEV